MTIDEAIKILGCKDSHIPAYSPEEREQADQLGIEALKRIKVQKGNPKFGRYLPLPGETED